jgi:stage II sporulation protein AA (anti-sigma F factor antagonist)
MQVALLSEKNMSLTINKKDSVIVICAEGQMNSSNASELERELLAQLDSGEHRVVFDLSLVGYVSSAGLRVVLVLAKRLKQVKGTLVLCGLQPKVHEVFDISGFLSILTVLDTREDAIKFAENF